MPHDFNKKPSLWEIFIYHYLASPLYKKYVKSLGLKGNEKVLDFGSGMGTEAKHIAKILDKGNGYLTCVDVSQAWMEEAKKRLKKYSNVDFQLGQIETLPIGDNFFDVIVMHFVLHHIEKEQRQAKLKLLASKLKTNGKVFIREPMHESHGLPLEDIRNLMQKAGLKETSFKMTRSVLRGNKMYEGVYEKMG
jgi:ubiquinone/menaquinone biosynthesis C-methylase UbiE